MTVLTRNGRQKAPVTVSIHVNDQSIGTSLANISSTRAFHLKDKGMKVTDLRNYDAEVVAMKRIEVRLDFHDVIECMHFRCVSKPSSTEVSQAEVDRMHQQRVFQDCYTWAEYVLEEKKRQMQVGDPKMWPPKPWPWKFEDVLSMPVVIWVSHKNNSKSGSAKS